MIAITSTIDQVTIDLGKRANGLSVGIDRAIGRGAQEVAREAKAKAPKAFSTLTQAIIATRESPGTHIVTAGTRYARYTEEGTGPGGIPPLQAMKDWIRVKRIVPRDPNMSQDQLAHVIRRSITRRGTPDQPFLRPALADKIPRIRELVIAAILAETRA